MNRVILALSTALAIIVACGKESSGPTNTELTETGEASEITEVSAIVTCYANPTPDMGNVTLGVLFSTIENPSLDNGVQVFSKELDGNNRYVVSLTHLAPNTTYYYKSFVQYGGVYRYGKTKSFKTLSYSISIEAKDAVEVTELRASLNGMLSISSKAPLSCEVWFLWSKTESDVEDIKAKGIKQSSALGINGTFSSVVSDLEPNTQYYYIAAARVQDDVYYSNVRSFTTRGINVEVNALGASDVTVSNATLKAQFVLDAIESFKLSAQFYYSTTESTIDGLKRNGTQINVAISDKSFSKTVSGLSSDTKYYYVAVLTVNGKEFNSEVKQFKTEAINVTITTEEASSVSYLKATLNGYVDVKNSESLTTNIWFRFGPDESLDTEQTEEVKDITLLEGTVNTTITTLDVNATYYYQVCALVYDTEFKGDIKSFKTKSAPDGSIDLNVTLKKEDGTRYCVFWAECNLGASSPEDYGDFYAWGETAPKDGDYFYTTYKWMDDSQLLTKYNVKSEKGIVDNLVLLEPCDDAAHVALGGKWRIPRKEEWEALLQQCTWTWKKRSGHSGYEIEGKGNSIFLPASGIKELFINNRETYGDYWSSTLDVIRPMYGWYLFASEEHKGLSYHHRYAGLSIRPVYVDE